MGIVKAVCVSDVRGVQKQAVDSAVFEVDHGLAGDAHAGSWHRQVSLLSWDKVEDFRARGAEVDAGAFGENLLVAGIDFRTLPVGTRFKAGGVVLEMTQIGKECHTHCQIYHKVGDCIMPREGVFAKVVQGGTIAVGDEMTVHPAEGPRPYRAAVVTVSDKGAAGQREDKSGPLLAQMLAEAGFEVIESLMVPDEQKRIETELIRLCDGRQAELVVTTGGTGFAQRDVTPEATLAVATRNAPGIAEAIRAESLKITGRAMLSRGASVIRGRSLIINLPGSPKAVKESLDTVLPQLDHGLKMLLGHDGECAAKPEK
ncbi:MOSC domain-containing protein [Ruminococcaceae bacterium OttesenSCG-928-A11]|nr:MOSC domain-containing protein [Ruminococcaceae bacterium OttesenSCG-928-A11]